MKRLVGLAVALMVGLAACEDFAAPTDSDTGPPVGGSGQFTLQKVSGDSQTGNPGQELADPYVVRVVDAAGGAVPGVPVGFAIQQGGGALSSSVVATDSSGIASVTATLPETINTDQTVVAGSEVAANTVSFTSTSIATTPGAANIRVVSGDGQKGIVRDTLLDPLVVEVTDGEGVAVQGVSVRWKVQSGSGSVRENPTVTNAQGLAQNRWRVGDVPGDTEEIVAWIEPDVAAPDTVSFTAELTGVPDTIEIVQGALELDNHATKSPELVIGDTVFMAPGHWADKGFKAIVRDSEDRRVRGATLTWTVTDDVPAGIGAVGDEPEGGGAEAVMVNTATDGGITVWRKAPDCDPEGDEPCNDEWIGATLSLERYPDVTPVTLDALIRDRPGT